MPHNDDQASTPAQGHGIQTISLPDSVRESCVLSPELMAEALTFLHRDGIIILANAIDTNHIDALQAILGPEAEQVAQDPNHHFNFGRETRNMDQAPPLEPELMYEDIWANPAAVAILKNVMGPELVCHYANGNTALRATGRQPVHSDIHTAHPLFPFAYAINIPLCDVNAENGSTEIWPGSHRDSNIDQHDGEGSGEGHLTIKHSLLEERRKHCPPVQPSSRKGSLIIRDIRLWHAGMPNRTPAPRIMLAFVVQPKWFQAPSKVLIPEKARSVVEAWQKETGLEYAALWVEGDVDHRKVTSDDVDFSSGNARMRELKHCMHAMY
jgi:ectoine hydroxylase-related dioxygenase (phytanoyl-CoA dioxygenase family)